MSEMSMMTLMELIQDIHAMDEELWHYEARYGLRSQYFYELYKVIIDISVTGYRRRVAIREVAAPNHAGCRCPACNTRKW